MAKKKSGGTKRARKLSKKKSKAKKSSVAKKASKKLKIRRNKQKKAVFRKNKAIKSRKLVKRAISKVKSAMPKGSGQVNLIVTYDPNHRGAAEAEMKELFKRVGATAQIVSSDVEGLFKVRTKDAKKVVKGLLALCRSEPNMFCVTHKYIPIDVWCRSEVADMQRAIKGFVKEIGLEEKWKMGLNKRRWDKMHGTQLILTLTDVIDRPKVDLVNPEKIVQVEIIGEETGVSLLLPDEILEVLKIKGPVF